ncbi:MAG TPA: DUF721 domain-containing protein [Agriterribacter sp.]|nr:DUF721 domain-containing protein [Agriterribacter sp.]
MKAILIHVHFAKMVSVSETDIVVRQLIFFEKKWKPLPLFSLQHLNGSCYLSSMGELSMGDAMKQFLKKSKLKGSVQALQITDIWGELMGKTIARYTDKIQIINRTLFIATTVAPLKNELMFQREKIIQRVNEALGENLITEIVIQ